MAAVRFTPQQRDMSALDAMRDNELRPRILHYVAAKRNLSRGGALRFIEGQLYHELGIVPGGRNSATLGQMLAHLDYPHLDGPKALDGPLAHVFNDYTLLHQVIRAIALDQGVQEIEALEQLHKGADQGARTLRAALQW